jgi:hypothetical protein
MLPCHPSHPACPERFGAQVDWTAVRSSGNNAEPISGHKMLTIFQAWR